MCLNKIEGFVYRDGARLSEELNESFYCCDRHSKVRIFGNEAVVGFYYARGCQPVAIFCDCRGAYSKALAVPSCGVSVPVAILMQENVVNKTE